MYCTQCGEERRETDQFCPQCGNAVNPVPPPVPQPAQRLLLDKRNKKIAGVCAGFARYFDVDIMLMRVLWLAIAICTGGVGFIVYVAAWIIVPADTDVYGDVPYPNRT